MGFAGGAGGSGGGALEWSKVKVDRDESNTCSALLGDAAGASQRSASSKGEDPGCPTARPALERRRQNFQKRGGMLRNSSRKCKRPAILIFSSCWNGTPSLKQVEEKDRDLRMDEEMNSNLSHNACGPTDKVKGLRADSS